MHQALFEEANEAELLINAIKVQKRKHVIKDFLLIRKEIQGLFAISSRHPEWKDVEKFDITHYDVVNVISALEEWKKEANSHYEKYEGIDTFETASRKLLPLLRTYGKQLGEEHLVCAVLELDYEVTPKLKLKLMEAGIQLATLLYIFAMKKQMRILTQLVSDFANEISEAYKEIPFQIKQGDHLIEIDKVNEIIPVAFTAFLDESIGPQGFVADPPDFDIILVSRAIVGSFAIIDFELVNRSEFILNTSHQAINIDGVEVEGTFLSLFYSRAIESARGGFELHSINIFINDKYQGHLLSFAPSFKAHFIYFGKLFKDLLQQYDKMLPQLNEQELKELREQSCEFIQKLRRELANHVIHSK